MYQVRVKYINRYLCHILFLSHIYSVKCLPLNVHVVQMEHEKIKRPGNAKMF